jgi:hypothetical protein
MSATGLVATMLAGGFLLADGSQGFGLLMLVCGPLGVTLNALLVRRNMQRQRDRIAPGVLTGRVLEEPTGVPIAADEPRWTGGGNVSTDVGRMNAGSPLAVLGLTGGNLELRFRPRRLAALFGAGPCRW